MGARAFSFACALGACHVTVPLLSELEATAPVLEASHHPFPTAAVSYTFLTAAVSPTLSLHAPPSIPFPPRSTLSPPTPSTHSYAHKTHRLANSVHLIGFDEHHLHADMPRMFRALSTNTLTNTLARA